MRLGPLTLEDVKEVAQWRALVPESLRTPVTLTPEMQAAFYRQVLSDQRTPHRYWAVRNHDFIGMVGLTDIQWENGLAEISLIVSPPWRGDGRGAAAVALVLEEAFERMRLETVFGECYVCNPAVHFWQRIAERYQGDITMLPRRKMWAGTLHHSLYFSIGREQWLATKERA
jgi:RimJ/RimL family protein N-acetyltransferase